MQRSGLRILGIDSAPQVRTRFAEWLSPVDVGLIFDEAAHLDEALARLDDAAYDVIIVSLPLPSGATLYDLRQIKERCGNAKIMILTPLRSSVLVQACRDVGADEVFDRAFGLDELQKRIGVIARGGCP